MPDPLTDLHFVVAPRVLHKSGLLGWVSARYGDLRLDGIALRRSVEGRLLISFPSRRDDQSREHPYFRPIDCAARRAIECQIIEALGLDGGEGAS